MKRFIIALFIVIYAVFIGSPVLAVSITLPAGTTNNATYITTTTAQLNGFVSDDGGEACQVRFQYYSGSGTWTDNQTGWVTGYVTDDNPDAAITGLTNNTLYYYRIEIKNSAGTYDGDSSAFSAYDAPTMPSTWFQTPNLAKFKHAFFAGLYNYIADTMKMPRATFYMLATLFVCLALAIVTLIIGKRLMPAVIVLAVAMTLGSLIQILPLFFVAFALIFILGTIKMGHPREE